MDDVAMVVGEHLHLDVAWIFDVLLHEHGAVAEVFLRFTGSTFQLVFQLVLLTDDMHAFATAPCRRFDEHGIGQGVGLCQNLAQVTRQAESHGDVILNRRLPCGNLVAHQPHGIGIRTDEN